ncbi:hypothetical protein C0416_00190 [bacterium]|nr:hypothetical protein [bacterium]
MKKSLLTFIASTVVAMMLVAPAAHAATSDPDDLVNTEAFMTIAPGDGAEDVELQFGTDAAGRILMYNFANDRFEFGNDLYVNGGLEVQNDIDQYGNTLTLDSDNVGAGADVSVVANQGSDSEGVLKYNATTNEWEIRNNGGSYYSVTTSNDITNLDGVDSNSFTLDQDDTTGDVTLQFGATLAESLKWDSLNNRFVLSDDLFIDGSLTLNGILDFDQNEAVNMVLHQGIAFPGGAAVEGQTFYRTDLDAMYIYDGAQWVAMADAPGGLSIFLAPQYPNTTYFNDGTNNVGRLAYDFDATNFENYYRWTTTKALMQDYDVKVRIQVPLDFSSWDVAPIEFKYRTNTTNAANNVIDLSMLDTADAGVTLTNNAGLVSSVAGQWVESTNMTIGGTPTFTPGDWLTVTIKLATTQTNWADVGSLVLNYLR